MRIIPILTLIAGSCFTSSLFAHENEQLNYNIINIQAEASRQVANDEMRAILYIEKSNRQPADLANQINQLMNQAIATAKKYPAVKVETGAQSTYPIYDTDGRKLKEWRSRAEVYIESTDFKAASQLVSELQQNFQTQSIGFSVSENQRKKVENELMLEVSKSFQQRAQTLAQAWNKSGFQLVNLNMNTNNYTIQPLMRATMAKMEMASDAVATQNVAGGDSKITVNANGTIQLK